MGASMFKHFWAIWIFLPLLARAAPGDQAKQVAQYRQQGAFAHALSVGQQAMADDPYDTVLRREVLLTQIALGDREVGPRLVQLVQDDSWDPENHLALATFYKEAGAWKRAMEAVQNGLAADADYSRAWFEAGEILLVIGEEESARQYYEEAIKRGHGHDEAQLRLDYLDSGANELLALAADHPEVGWLAIAAAAQLDQAGNSPQALQVLQKAAIQSPHVAEVHYEAGRLLLRFEGQQGAAAAAFKAATRLNPSDPAAWYGLGQAWMQHSGREDDARHAFETTVEVAQGHPDWVGLGRLALERAGGRP